MSNNLYQNIRLMLWDVDGVLTNGDIYISDIGECFKQFNVKDGVAVALLKKHGIKTGVLSGKHSSSLTKRCEQLDLDIIKTGIHNKMSALNDICAYLNISLNQIAYIGDDVIDFKVMQSVGLTFAPADAHSLIINVADHITIAAGGKGVAREAAEILLSHSGYSIESMYKPLLDDWNNLEVVQ